jgi:hypothetical protein
MTYAQLQIILLVLSYIFPAFGLVPWYVLWSPVLFATTAAVLLHIMGKR